MNNISFKSIPIYEVKIKKRDPNNNWDSVDAVFSELSSFNGEDKKTIKKLNEKWSKTPLMKSISDDFDQHRDKYNASYYAIELKDKTLPPEKRILSLACITNDEDTKHIDCLQAAPCISKRLHPEYKGAGEVMIYGIVKKAKPEGTKSINLESRKAAESFYKHIGFKIVEGHYYDFWQLTKTKFSRYMSYIENKYQIKRRQKAKKC